MPAPAGNQFAIGNNGGRPRHYQTAEEYIATGKEYFTWIKGEKGTEIGADGKMKEWDREPEPATITGLVLYMGFESRSSFADYAKHEEFSYAVKALRTWIEHEYEKKLSGNNVAGIIFALKNLGWADNTQITGANGTPLIAPQPQVIINQVSGLPLLGNAEEDLSIEEK